MSIKILHEKAKEDWCRLQCSRLARARGFNIDQTTFCPQGDILWLPSESTSIETKAFSFRPLSTYIIIVYFLLSCNSTFNQRYVQKYVVKTQNPDHKSQTIRTLLSCIKHLTITKMYNQSLNEQRREPLRPIVA
jgi:hypothetical protein